MRRFDYAVFVTFAIGRFSEAGLLEWMRFVIFRARSRSRRTSGPISEYGVASRSGSWT